MTSSHVSLSICKSLVLAAVVAVLLGLPANSQILPDAPIEGIRVTMFSDEGFKLWNLQGSSASNLNDGEIEVIELDLEIFQGEKGEEIDMHILGAKAIYQSESRSVAGQGGVIVEGDFYKIEGDSWRYSQDDRIVKVTSNVKIVIDYELDAFLK